MKRRVKQEVVLIAARNDAEALIFLRHTKKKLKWFLEYEPSSHTTKKKPMYVKLGTFSMTDFQLQWYFCRAFALFLSCSTITASPGSKGPVVASTSSKTSRLIGHLKKIRNNYTASTKRLLHISISDSAEKNSAFVRNVFTTRIPFFFF